MCDDEKRDPEEFDPFAQGATDFFRVEPQGDVISEGLPDYNEIERLGLMKACEHCSKKEGQQVYMQTVEGTAADIYQSELEDNIDVRTWAVCTKCRRVRLIA